MPGSAASLLLVRIKASPSPNGSYDLEGHYSSFHDARALLGGKPRLLSSFITISPTRSPTHPAKSHGHLLSTRTPAPRFLGTTGVPQPHLHLAALYSIRSGQHTESQPPGLSSLPSSTCQNRRDPGERRRNLSHRQRSENPLGQSIQPRSRRGDETTPTIPPEEKKKR